MSKNPSTDVNQAIPLAPSDARRVIPGDVDRKSIDELLKIVDEPYNQPLWPIQKGLGNARAARSHLPISSDPGEGLKIVIESGPDTLKLKSVVSKVSKKKAAVTHTTSCQKDMLVAKALKDGTVKPSAHRSCDCWDLSRQCLFNGCAAATS
ncbi:hypothetical protein M422DRAFT_779776 [Sphaerobolus stellatus SS14]|uniref:Uncharacterized protein n=1 Tax=Sphaerobolus stellatus (strain SS14) TaxID=990650 RepID=A0A0C9V8P0_SPHS4|nr:hypothetical protein M422DRAFT_779776 [Sphaerobolus stellatus SS14]